MSLAFVLDYYTGKNYYLENIPDNILSQLEHGQKIVYHVKDRNIETLSIGEYLIHKVNSEKKVSFEKILEGEDLSYFEKQEDRAKSLYPDFRKSFRKNFPGSMPITARFHIYSDQVYFYFYAQERYNFADYARELRSKIGKNIFLYQVSPRDLIRMAPAYQYIIGDNGIGLCETSKRDLPDVSIDDVFIQGLEGRDLERLKTRNGKFKASLGYEVDLYREESKKYPPKGSKVKDIEKNITADVISYNIMTGDVKIRTDEGDIFFVPYSSLKILKNTEKIV